MWDRQDMKGLLLPYILIAGSSSNFDSFLVKKNSFICECILIAMFTCSIYMFATTTGPYTLKSEPTLI